MHLGGIISFRRSRSQIRGTYIRTREGESRGRWNERLYVESGVRKEVLVGWLVPLGYGRGVVAPREGVI